MTATTPTPPRTWTARETYLTVLHHLQHQAQHKAVQATRVAAALQAGYRTSELPNLLGMTRSEVQQCLELLRATHRP